MKRINHEMNAMNSARQQPAHRISLQHTMWVFALLVSLIGLFLPTTAHAAPTLDARVDRASVSDGDSLTLTLTLSDTGNYPDPDFSTMQRDFAIVNVSQGSNHILSNGRLQSSTEWRITLMPKRSGLLTIPAFIIDRYSSKPIAIRVQGANASADTAGGDPVFVEAEVDRDSVYVQQQVLLKVRVFHAIALDDMNLTEPEFDNATVRKVAQEEFQREIGGVSYQVHELSYAVFPQQSGDLTIPELVFSGAEMQRRRSLFDFPGQGRPVRRLSKQMTVHVKPIPPTFTGKVWLPARNLTLQETWGGNPEDVRAGSSITRSVEIHADGLMAAQLPALDMPTLQQARFYADQPALDDQANADGMHGLRKENAALIPAQEGALQLPEVRIIWWDLDSDSEKVATIPAQTLLIRAAANATSTPIAPANPNETRNDNQRSPAIADAKQAPVTTAEQYPQLWMIATAIFAAAWLLTLVLYWRLRRTTLAPSQEISVKPAGDRGAEWFAQLMRACGNNDAPAAYTALSRWVRTAHGTPTIERWLHALPDQPKTAALRDSVENLQRTIYREPEISWRGESLSKALTAWRKRKHPGATPVDALPSLYPT